jgi:hypothetical protein
MHANKEEAWTNGKRPQHERIGSALAPDAGSEWQKATYYGVDTTAASQGTCTFKLPNPPASHGKVK